MTHKQLIRTIRRELKARRWSLYQLHQQLKDHVSKQTIYNFLQNGQPAMTDTLVAILNVLEIPVGKA